MLQKYITASGKLNDLIKKPQSGEQSSSVQFNLPKLQLPEFNGKLTEWKRFIALFDRMVHSNERIDHGIKIEYLKTCVKGQAAKIINHIDPNPDNNLTCYDLLRKIYENKRELLGALIDDILRLPKITQQGSPPKKNNKGNGNNFRQSGGRAQNNGGDEHKPNQSKYPQPKGPSNDVKRGNADGRDNYKGQQKNVKTLQCDEQEDEEEITVREVIESIDEPKN